MAGSAGNQRDAAAGPPPDGSGFRFGIAVAGWHAEITGALFRGAHATLRSCGVKEEDIVRIDVPGSFELIAGARSIIENEKVNAVICLGCLVRGETPHFEFISQAVANGLAMLSAQHSMPFIFGVLTTANLRQARARAGGKMGNKGSEAALAAVKMAGIRKQFGKSRQIGFQ
jgi:6,7-dimethyl-8-ribityllumazine synthase